MKYYEIIQHNTTSKQNNTDYSEEIITIESSQMHTHSGRHIPKSGYEQIDADSQQGCLAGIKAGMEKLFASRRNKPAGNTMKTSATRQEQNKYKRSNSIPSNRYNTFAPNQSGSGQHAYQSEQEQSHIILTLNRSDGNE